MDIKTVWFVSKFVPIGKLAFLISRTFGRKLWHITSTPKRENTQRKIVTNLPSFEQNNKRRVTKKRVTKRIKSKAKSGYENSIAILCLQTSSKSLLLARKRAKPHARQMRPLFRKRMNCSRSGALSQKHVQMKNFGLESSVTFLVFQKGISCSQFRFTLQLMTHEFLTMEFIAWTKIVCKRSSIELQNEEIWGKMVRLSEGLFEHFN